MKFTGKNAEEAFQKAEKTLQTSRENLVIEKITSEEKFSFFGFQKKMTVIHVRPYAKPSTKEETGKARNNTGLAWAKDNHIYVKNGENGPVIYPHPDARLFHNGVEKQEGFVMKEEDDITFILPTTEKKTNWSIEVTEDKQRVQLHITPGYILHYVLKDTEPAETFVLELEEKKEQRQTVTLEDIYQALTEKQIAYGIQREEIERALAAETPGTYTIAQGKEVVHGTDGKIVYYVDVKKKHVVGKQLEDGTIDFRYSREIPNVDKNTVIAKVIPPIEGQKGRNVYGEEVMPRHGKPVILKLGEGVIEEEKEPSLCKSTQRGRPQVEESGRIVRLSVLPQFTQQGNVNMESGNIDFVGDVEVLGNIEETMVVKAYGDLHVHGNIWHAAATAGNALLVKNSIVQSKVIVGSHYFKEKELIQQLALLNQKMQQIIYSIHQLYEASSTKLKIHDPAEFKSLLSLLIEKRFQTFLPKVKQFIEQVEREKSVIHEEWLYVAQRLYRSFIILHERGVQTKEELSLLLKQMKWLQSTRQTHAHQGGDVTFSSALHSTIASSGDVLVTGKGCSHTTIQAGGQVRIPRSFVGGTIFARKGVEIGMVGSKTGVKSIIEVPENAAIQIQLAMEDTVIKVGKQSYIFTENTRNVYGHLNDNGELLLKRDGKENPSAITS
ncbi:flagellar assembly protein A [Aliibacillus thermotolerans]|uniref:Flagellar assembly protein A n=1 Tax=Aliibacillus thermotolerans TaxID=1834418 RepID=A0ABW0U331_9BACI|nr:flagellar assembly protein A [Aliibacillus thermotolerans]MDA3129227.1 DUF342 domain-containing protein [Aliibacillus thermotolerans]